MRAWLTVLHTTKLVLTAIQCKTSMQQGNTAGVVSTTRYSFLNNAALNQAARGYRYHLLQISLAVSLFAPGSCYLPVSCRRSEYEPQVNQLGGALPVQSLLA